MTEPKKTGRFAKGNPGKPKGAVSHLTRSAKEAFQYAFDQMGGAAGLATWGAGNPDEFYKIYSKLIPIDTQVTGPNGGALQTVLTVREVIVKGSGAA